jgi:hypothetical protein
MLDLVGPYAGNFAARSARLAVTDQSRDGLDHSRVPVIRLFRRRHTPRTLSPSGWIAVPCIITAVPVGAAVAFAT